MSNQLTDLSSLSSINVKERAANASTPNNEPLPKGKYVCTIEKAELKPTNAGDGTYLDMHFRVTQEKYNGRMVWHKFNVANRNPKAVDIAIEQLSLLINALGLPSIPGNPQTLVGKVVQVDVGIDPAKNGYEARNKVFGYAATDATATSAPSGASDADMPF